MPLKWSALKWYQRWSTLKWYQRTPLVNLVYDLLFDEPPSVANVEKLLNVYGLVSALLLGSILGLQGSVSVAELEEADRRYHVAQLEGRCWFNPDSFEWPIFGGRYSFRLAFFYNLATVCISATLFCTVLVFMCFTSHDFDNDKPAFDRWWTWGRWPVAFIFLTMVVGCQQTFTAFVTLGEIKWPTGCMRTEDSLDFEKGNLAVAKDYDFAYFYARIQQWGLIIPMLFTLFFMSFASASRYKLEEEIKALSTKDADMPETLQA
jgi:hypothetical protein